MPRKYRRHTNRALWYAESLVGAVEEVKSGTSIRKSALKYGIPESSVRRKIKEANNEAKKIPMKTKLGRRPAFTKAQENELVSHVLKLAKGFKALHLTSSESSHFSMQKITPFEMAELFNRVYLKVATMEKALPGFRAAGIFTQNKEKFTVKDFEPSGHCSSFSPRLQLSDNENENDSEIIKHGKKRTLVQRKMCNARPRPSRRLAFDTSSSSEGEENVQENLCCDDSDMDDEESCLGIEVCLICGEFGKDDEIWYLCVFCSLWCHAECRGWGSSENYTCDTCLRKERWKLL
ncbi:hypothetical protein PR048_026701 [Dryococelus australis]|uniref:HTH psq-type domain-containing protein n=1 Tax=Dryococelus australis TaxID=614101 RepID=A0ABQ9GM36_9NEOP|nr:hypothetical protein PR048_026701 [Dryococelus australis]